LNPARPVDYMRSGVIEASSKLTIHDCLSKPNLMELNSFV